MCSCPKRTIAFWITRMAPGANRVLLADDTKIITPADYTPGRMFDACDVPSEPTRARHAMHQVFAEIDRLRIAEAERAAEQYRREMRPRSRSRFVSIRRRRQTVSLRPASQNF